MNIGDEVQVLQSVDVKRSLWFARGIIIEKDHRGVRVKIDSITYYFFFNEVIQV